MSRPPRLALLDRDGTLIAAPAQGRRYILGPEEVELAPGAVEAVGLLNRLDIPVAVVTNQRAVARGLLTPSQMSLIHDRIGMLLSPAHIDAWFVCPHAEGACECRKPLPGLVAQALARFGVAGTDAFIVGDAASDMLAGSALGLRCILLGSAGAGCAVDATAADLLDAVHVALAWGSPVTGL